jgi:hypothetical protein
MPPQPPLIRLQEVALGLASLADALEKEGIDARSLRYWSRELVTIRAEIEAVRAAGAG